MCTTPVDVPGRNSAEGTAEQLVQVYRFLHKAQVGKSRGSLGQPEVRTTEPVQSRCQNPTGRQQQIQTAAINKQNVDWGGKTKKRRKKPPRVDNDKISSVEDETERLK